MSLVAPQPVESSWTGDRTHVHWQADSLPLDHQRSPLKKIIYFWLHQVLVEGRRLSFPEACGILVP